MKRAAHDEAISTVARGAVGVGVRTRACFAGRNFATRQAEGAGEGEIGFAAAKVVGARGRVYLTELDEKKRKNLEEEVRVRGLKNVTVVQAAEKHTNLPDACCDTIVLRRVYHHLTAPAEMDMSLLRSLKIGGQLAVIDFPPRKWLGESDPVEGVPANRGGHGIP